MAKTVIVVVMLVGFVLAAPLTRSAYAQGDGAAVYAAQKCSLCHALDGKGNAKGALDEVGSKLTADDIRQWIVNPVDMAAKKSATRKPAMKAYATLPKADLDALVTFLSAKKKK